MSTRFEVPAEKLAWRCDLSFLPFTCTAEMTPLEDFIGQERAIRAIEFGLGREQAGFQYFCHRTYRHRQNQHHQSLSQKNYQPANGFRRPIRRAPEDWCYVYNFTDADRPLALRIRRGWGKVLKADMEQLVQTVQREAKKMFESDEFAHQRQEMIEQMQKKQQQMMEGLMEEANRNGFPLRMTPSGIVLLPTKDGKPMQEADYLALPAAEKNGWRKSAARSKKKSKTRCAKEENSNGRSREKLEEAETRGGGLSRAHSAGRSQRKIPRLSQSRRLSRRCARSYSEKSARFKGAEARAQGGGAGPMQFGEPPTDPFLPYRVNVFVDNSDTHGPPIIVETNPTYHNLIRRH